MSCPIMIRLKMPQGTINQHSAYPNSMTTVFNQADFNAITPICT